MKGIYVIIAFLACCTMIIANETNAERDEPERSAVEEKQLTKIPTSCYEKSTNDTIHLAHENDCTKYYKCFMSKRMPLECPIFNKQQKQKLHFNAVRQVCDWPWQAGCQNCPGNPEDGYPRIKISHEREDCTQYYECINGEKRLRRCPAGLCFSRTCQACIQERANGNCNYKKFSK